MGREEFISGIMKSKKLEELGKVIREDKSHPLHDRLIKSDEEKTKLGIGKDEFIVKGNGEVLQRNDIENLIYRAIIGELEDREYREIKITNGHHLTQRLCKMITDEMFNPKRF